MKRRHFLVALAGFAVLPQLPRLSAESNGFVRLTYKGRPFVFNPHPAQLYFYNTVTYEKAYFARNFGSRW